MKRYEVHFLKTNNQSFLAPKRERLEAALNKLSPTVWDVINRASYKDRSESEKIEILTECIVNLIDAKA